MHSLSIIVIDNKIGLPLGLKSLSISIYSLLKVQVVPFEFIALIGTFYILQVGIFSFPAAFSERALIEAWFSPYFLAKSLLIRSISAQESRSAWVMIGFCFQIVTIAWKRIATSIIVSSAADEIVMPTVDCFPGVSLGYVLTQGIGV